MDDFCLRGGKIEIVASPDINETELSLISEAEAEFKIKEHTLESISSFEAPPNDADRFQLLSWMLANGYLEIKFAVKLLDGHLGFSMGKLAYVGMLKIIKLHGREVQTQQRLLWNRMLKTYSFSHPGKRLQHPISRAH